MRIVTWFSSRDLFLPNAPNYFAQNALKWSWLEWLQMFVNANDCKALRNTCLKWNKIKARKKRNRIVVRVTNPLKGQLPWSSNYSQFIVLSETRGGSIATQKMHEERGGRGGLSVCNLTQNFIRRSMSPSPSHWQKPSFLLGLCNIKYGTCRNYWVEHVDAQVKTKPWLYNAHWPRIMHFISLSVGCCKTIVRYNCNKEMQRKKERKEFLLNWMRSNDACLLRNMYGLTCNTYYELKNSFWPL